MELIEIPAGGLCIPTSSWSLYLPSFTVTCKLIFLGDDRRKWETEFGIKHYAGCVTYNAKGFVDKNRDVQQDVFFDIISRSKNEFVQDLYTLQDLSNLGQKTVANGITTVSRGTSKGNLQFRIHSGRIKIEISLL